MIIETMIKKPIKDIIVINNTEDAIEVLANFYTELMDKEHFSVMELDVANQVIAIRVISIGTIERCIVHPREVLRNAIIDNASKIIIAHNHPSLVSLPSNYDIELTERLKEACDIVGINLVDHIIIGQQYYSFLQHNQIVGK